MGCGAARRSDPRFLWGGSSALSFWGPWGIRQPAGVAKRKEEQSRSLPKPTYLKPCFPKPLNPQKPPPPRGHSCDYCGTLRGVGPVTALKLIRQHGSIEKILPVVEGKHDVPPARAAAAAAAPRFCYAWGSLGALLLLLLLFCQRRGRRRSAHRHAHTRTHRPSLFPFFLPPTPP